MSRSTPIASGEFSSNNQIRAPSVRTRDFSSDALEVLFQSKVVLLILETKTLSCILDSSSEAIQGVKVRRTLPASGVDHLDREERQVKVRVVDDRLITDASDQGCQHPPNATELVGRPITGDGDVIIGGRPCVLKVLGTSPNGEVIMTSWQPVEAMVRRNWP